MKYVAPLGGAPNDPYVDHNPGGGIDGSIPKAAAIEHPLRELDHLISFFGLTPAEGDLEQVRKAIQAATSDINIGMLRRPGFTTVEGTLDTPSGSPGLNYIYIVGDSPTGLFSGHAGKLAQCTGNGTPSSYAFKEAPEGHLVRDITIAANLPGSWKRRTASSTPGQRWLSAAAATDLYGPTRLATSAEAKDEANDVVAVTPKGLGEATAGDTLQVSRGATQTIPAGGGFTTVIWDSVLDASAYFTLNTGTGIMTCVRAGTYMVSTAIASNTAITAQAVIEFKKTLAGGGSFSRRPLDDIANSYTLSASLSMVFAVGDTLSIEVFNANGFTINAASTVRNYCDVVRVAS